jgi:hypothetical protein
MKKLLALAALLLAGCLNAQNLVLNPSFETTTGGCVGFTGGLDNWDDANSGADSCSSPDLFATCFPGFFPTTAPGNWLGYQNPRTGTRYAGIITYSPGFAFNCSPLGSDQYREYIEGQLSAPLVAGQSYCVSFWVNLAGKVMWSTNQMSVYFSNSLFQHNFCSTPGVAPVTPQLNYTGGVLSDTTNWVQLSWTYVATGGEQYFTIGNFKTNSNTTRANSNCNTQNYVAYYFIDDVSITPGACQSCALSASISAQSNVTCNGGNNGSATVNVTGGSGSQTYTWSPSGGNAATASNLSAGTYTVDITDGSCTASKTVTITQPGAIFISPSATGATCGQSNGSANAVATGGTGVLAYSWSTGTTGAAISGVSAGTYTVYVTDANSCMNSATVNVSGTSAPSASATVTQSVTCSGGMNGAASVNISGGTPGYTVNWSNATTGTSISNVPKGPYSYTVTDGAGCITSGTVNIAGAPDIITNSQLDCSTGTGSATVTATGGTPGFTYSWTPGGMSTDIVTGLANGNYTCTVTDANNCVRYVQVVVNCGTTGILQYSSQNVVIYPNPAGKTVSIATLGVPASISLYNVRGELLMTRVPPESETTFDLGGLPAGVYFARIRMPDNTIQHVRILKQ